MTSFAGCFNLVRSASRAFGEGGRNHTLTRSEALNQRPVVHPEPVYNTSTSCQAWMMGILTHYTLEKKEGNQLVIVDVSAEFQRLMTHSTEPWDGRRPNEASRAWLQLVPLREVALLSSLCARFC